MPHGYKKTRNSNSKCVYRKTHKNGEKTKVVLEKIPDSDRWFGHIEDEGATDELGRFNSKSEALSGARNWMQQHPKGLQSQGFGGGGVLPGLDGAQQSNDFFG